MSSRSLTRTAARAMGRAALLTATLAAGYLVVTTGLPFDGVADLAPAAPGAGTQARATSADRVALLVERHHCWTGAAPADFVGRTPGHVVVTLDGRVRYSAGLVDEALDHVFVAPVPGMVVYAFCR